MLIELCRQVLEVNTLCSAVKKAGIPSPVVVGSYSCASRFDAKNLIKAFERKYKLKDYEVIRP